MITGRIKAVVIIAAITAVIAIIGTVVAIIWSRDLFSEHPSVEITAERRDNLPDPNKGKRLQDLLAKVVIPGNLSSADENTLNEICHLSQDVDTRNLVSNLSAEEQNGIKLVKLKLQARDLLKMDQAGHELTGDQVIKLHQCQQNQGLLAEKGLDDLISKYEQRLNDIPPVGDNIEDEIQEENEEDIVPSQRFGSRRRPKKVRKRARRGVIKTGDEEENVETPQAPGSVEENKDKLIKAQAILLKTNPTKEDVQFIVDEQPNLPDLDSNKVSTFLATHPFLDFDLKDNFKVILGKADRASPEEVSFINNSNHANRALSLGLTTQRQIEVFLSQHGIHPQVNVTEIARILRKDYFNVTEDDVELVKLHQNNDILKHKKNAIIHFLDIQADDQRQKAELLKETLRIKKSLWGEQRLEPQQEQLLDSNRFNRFGIAIHRELEKDKYSNPYGHTPPSLSDMLDRMNDAFLMYKIDPDPDTNLKICRNRYEQIVQEIIRSDMQSYYPHYYGNPTFEEWALDLLIAEVDSAFTPQTLGNPLDDPELCALFIGISVVMLKGHPRYSEFKETGSSLSTLKANYKSISSVDNYNKRIGPLIYSTSLLLEEPPINDILFNFKVLIISNLRRELESALPGTADPSALNLTADPTVVDVRKAIASEVHPAVVSYFGDSFLAILDKTPFDSKNLDLSLNLVRWFRYIAFDMSGIESCGNLTFDALTPDPSSIKAFAIRRARDKFLEAAHIVQYETDVLRAYQAWSSARNDFGKLHSDDDVFLLNDMENVDEAKERIISILKAELFEAIKANADGSIIEIRLKKFKDVLNVLGFNSKTYGSCNTAAQAIEAYNKSGQIPINMANKLRARVEKLYENGANPSIEDQVLPLLLHLRFFLSNNLSVWSEEERALFADLLSAKDINAYFRSPQNDLYRKYRARVALYKSTYVRHQREYTDQENSNKLYDELKKLSDELAATSIPAEKRVKYKALPAPKTIVNAPPGEMVTLDKVEAGKFKDWIGDDDEDRILLHMIDDPTSNEFESMFYNDEWKNVDSPVYGTQQPFNKNLLAFFFSSLPFDGTFSWLPTWTSYDRTLTPCTYKIPDALLSSLCNVDIHLQALDDDPAHLMLWALRAQQAFHLNIGKWEVQLIAAYRQVQKAAKSYPVKNELYLILTDVLDTPLTRNILVDMRTKRPEPPKKPKVIELFNCGICSPTDLKVLPGPSSGWILYLHKKMIDVLKKFRYPDSTEISQAWMQFWELQLLTALNPDIMLPRMRMWVHANENLVCNNNIVKGFIRNYAIQNRSSYLYDDTFFLCRGDSLKSNDKNRPVSYCTRGHLPDLPLVDPDPSAPVTLHTIQVDWQDVNAIPEKRGEDGPAKIKFSRAREGLQIPLKACITNWNFFGRDNLAVKIKDSPGIDAGGLSRDLINTLWFYLLNPVFSALMVDFANLLPNLYTDPLVGCIVGPLITLGPAKKLRPYRYFSKEIHDLIFSSIPPSDSDIYNSYIKLFGEESMESHVEANQSLIATLDNDEDLQGISYYGRSGLRVKDVFDGVLREYMCGQTVGDHMREIYEDFDDDESSVPLFYQRRFKEFVKLDMISRFQQFLMHLQEHFSRNSNYSELIVLRGMKAGQLTPQKFYENMCPPMVTTESILNGLNLQPTCTPPPDSTSWHVLGEDKTTKQFTIPLHLHPLRIRMRDGSQGSVLQIFSIWLRRWAPDVDIPTGLEAQIKRETDWTKRAALEEQLRKLKTEQNENQRKRELFLALVTGSSSPPLTGKTLQLECVSGQRNYEMAGLFAHTCYRQLDIPPVESQEMLELALDQFMQYSVTKYTAGNV